MATTTAAASTNSSIVEATTIGNLAEAVKVAEAKQFFLDTFSVVNVGWRGAKHIMFKSATTGVEFPMYVGEIIKLLQTGNISEGRVSGVWTFRKFGCKLSLGYRGN